MLLTFSLRHSESLLSGRGGAFPRYNQERENLTGILGIFLKEGIHSGRMARRRRKSGKKKGSGAAGFLLGLFLLAALAAGAAAAWLVLTPYGPGTETFVNVAPGSSAMRIGRQLEAAGVVRSRYAFDLVRWFRRGSCRPECIASTIRRPVTEVYERIARGDVFTIALTVPEGQTSSILPRAWSRRGWARGRSFLDAAASQTDLVADLDPGAKSLEGYLFPDTYRFSPKATAAQMAAAMVQALPRGGRATGIEGECASGGDHCFAGGARNGGGCRAPAGGQCL